MVYVTLYTFQICVLSKFAEVHFVHWVYNLSIIHKIICCLAVIILFPLTHFITLVSLYPLKTKSENQSFSNVFKWYRKKPVA